MAEPVPDPVPPPAPSPTPLPAPDPSVVTDPEAFTLKPFYRTRIVVVETIGFQPPEGEAQMVDSRYVRWLEAGMDEQVYKRKFTATEEWKPVDIGWAKEWPGVSVVHISNVGVGPLATIPTAAEREELARRIIEVKIGSADPDSVLLIPPGESLRVCPARPDKILIRSQHNTTRYQIGIFPR
jgi:hypothetical protein